MNPNLTTLLTRATDDTGNFFRGSSGLLGDKSYEIMSFLERS